MSLERARHRTCRSRLQLAQGLLWCPSQQGSIASTWRVASFAGKPAAYPILGAALGVEGAIRSGQSFAECWSCNATLADEPTETFGAGRLWLPKGSWTSWSGKHVLYIVVLTPASQNPNQQSIPRLLKLGCWTPRSSKAAVAGQSPIPAIFMREHTQVFCWKAWSNRVLRCCTHVMAACCHPSGHQAHIKLPTDNRKKKCIKMLVLVVWINSDQAGPACSSSTSNNYSAIFCWVHRWKSRILLALWRTSFGKSLATLPWWTSCKHLAWWRRSAFRGRPCV